MKQLAEGHTATSQQSQDPGALTPEPELRTMSLHCHQHTVAWEEADGNRSHLLEGSAL